MGRAGRNLENVTVSFFIRRQKGILLTRFEWPNGDKYIGQYINGKRNGLGDMQVVVLITIESVIVVLYAL